MNSRSTSSQSASVEQTTATLPLLGVSCSSCAVVIELALREVRGVPKAKVNIGSAEAYVNYDAGRTNVPKLVQAVRSAGYRVGSAN